MKFMVFDEKVRFMLLYVCVGETHSFSGSNSGTKVIQGEGMCLPGGVCVCVCGGSGLVELHRQKHLAKFVFYGRPVLCS